MANGNPFYIDPTGGIDTSAGIRGLASSVAGIGELQRQRKQEEQQAEAKRLLDERMKNGQTALQGAIGDPAKIAQVMIDYPELQKTAESVFQFTNDATKPIVTQTYSQVLSDPNNAVQYLTQGIEQVRAAGGNPQNMMADLQAFQTNPEQAFKQVELGVATVSPETYQAYQAQKPKEMTPYQQASIDIKRQELAQKRRESSNGGPVDLSVNMEKSLETAINDAVKSRSSSNSMSALAQQFREEKPTPGLFGTASNMFAKLTGQDTALRDLRIRQNALVNSQVIKFLPPGPATDKDIELVRQGAPTEMDNPEIVARWLDAMANMERYSADFNDFKSEWISANGNPGQARNSGEILGMEVKRGESMGSAAKRYLALSAEPQNESTITNETPNVSGMSDDELLSGLGL